jgi:hypothetical protein
MWSRPGGSGIVTETFDSKKPNTLEANPAASEPDLVSGSRAAFLLTRIDADHADERGLRGSTRIMRIDADYAD